MMDDGNDPAMRRKLMAGGGMSSKHADDMIRQKRDEKHHAAALKAMRESSQHTTFKAGISKKADAPEAFKKDEKTSSSGKDIFAAGLVIAILLGVFNNSSEDKTTTPASAPQPQEAKEVVLKISAPLSGKFVCSSGSKFITNFISTGPNKMIVSEKDPSLKGKPSINLLGIDIYAKSCQHAEQLINDYYRAFGPK